jgi:hypothetical protein
MGENLWTYRKCERIGAVKYDRADFVFRFESEVGTGDIEGCGCRSCAGKTRPGQLGAFILSGKVRRKKNLLRDTLQFTNYLGGSRTKTVGYNVSIE